MKASEMNAIFYKGKRVLVTGHTGFKGAWFTVVLNELGAVSCGYSLPPESGGLFEKICGEKLIAHVEGDIRDADRLKKAVLEFEPEIIFHLASVSNVPESFNNPYEAYSTNILGTVNLLEATRESGSVKSILVVTSDKVYENKSDGAVYSEADRLGGDNPYSVSKVSQDLIALSYKKTYLLNTGIATGRASNVLAGGDHNNTRLIPTVLNSFLRGTPVELRNSTQQRPWQSVLDALNGYLSIARKCFDDPQKFSGAWNIGPTSEGIKTVEDIVAGLQSYYEVSSGYSHIPWDGVKESATLGLDISKSMRELEWEPELPYSKMLWNVVEFFKLQQKQIPEYEICKKQINDYYTEYQWSTPPKR